MQLLNFEDKTIDCFLKTAYKMHKTLNPIDRYKDLKDKIKYYKDNEKITAVNKTANDILQEYNLSTTEEEKDFWSNSLAEQLNILDNYINEDYRYELRKKEA